MVNDTTGDVIINFRNVGEDGLLNKNSYGIEGYDAASDLWIDFALGTIVTDGDYNILLRQFQGTGMNLTQVRYNWFNAPCEPNQGIYNCAIYDKQNLLPATPFIVPTSVL